MGAIGGIIDSAIGAVSGTSHGTTLQDFLANFSSSEGIWSKTIDPYQTFDVSIKFYPSFWWPPTQKQSDKSWTQTFEDTAKNVGNSLMSSAQNAVKSLANNATGGLLGSIMNDIDIMKKHDDNPDAPYGDTTFMEYLAGANLIVGKSGWVGETAGQNVSPLELQLGIYCQEVIVPNFEVPSSGTSQCSFGEFPINGTYVKTDSNVVTLKIVNTKVPLHERIFYPWLRETTMNWWSYDQQPYTTATITVDFTKHSDIKYVFCGCRPQKIIMQQGTQESNACLTRDVSFLFDYMMVISNLKTCESLAEKLLSTGQSLINSSVSLVNA